eukprot:gene8680-11396_t
MPTRRGLRKALTKAAHERNANALQKILRNAPKHHIEQEQDKSKWHDHKAACTLLQLKYHSNDCESTALFGVNNLCPSCGKGILCTHHGCKEGGRRRHKKWCKIGKKRGAKKRDGADQALGKGGGGGGSGGGGGVGGGGAAARKQVR